MSKLNLFDPRAFEVGNVQSAPLATIRFRQLTNKDPEEVGKLLRSCEKHGFFYLDLENDVGICRIASAMQDLLRLMESYFNQPRELKIRDNVGSMTFG